MSFLETIRRANSYLEEQGRVSLRALKREFDLDDDALDELVGELGDGQQVATREGKLVAARFIFMPEPPSQPAGLPTPTRRLSISTTLMRSW